LFVALHPFLKRNGGQGLVSSPLLIVARQEESKLTYRMPAIQFIDNISPDAPESIIRNANEQPTSNGPTLPADLVSIIISNLQQDRLYATLAKMAQANSSFYDLVIPKLYETVTVTEWSLPRLKYGHDTCQNRPRESGVGIAVNSAGLKQTRKDRAVEYCLRLIIDVAYAFNRNLVDSVIRRKRHEHYKNVYEVVYTTRFFKRVPIWEERRRSNHMRPCTEKEGDEVCKKHHDFPPPTYQQLSDARQQAPTTVRVVLHPPLYLKGLDRQCLFRFIDTYEKRTCVDDQRFVVHGVSFDCPFRDIRVWAKLRADCYFAAHPIPPSESDTSIDLMIADWIWDLSNNSDVYGLRLFDVTDLILKAKTDSPLQDRAQATMEARRILKQHLRPPELRIMRWVQLCDSGNDGVKDEEEYPVSRPKQVSISFSSVAVYVSVSDTAVDRAYTILQQIT
jgi:hypothetical protein